MEEQIDESGSFKGSLVSILLSVQPSKKSNSIPIVSLDKDGGTIEVFVSPKSSLLARVSPPSGESVEVESGPLKPSESTNLILAVTWDFPNVSIYANGSLIATNNASQPSAPATEMSTQKNLTSKGSLNEQNEQKKIARKLEFANVAPSKGRVTVPPDKAFSDLDSARLQLLDQISSMSNGQFHQDTALAARLRAVICRTKKGHPLLQRLAGHLDLPLIVYAVRPLEETPAIISNARLRVTAHVAPSRVFPADLPMDLDFWLGIEGAHLNGTAYTNNEILLAFADTEAAHYDLGAEPLVAELRLLRGLGGNGQTPTILHTFLINVALCVIPLCEQIHSAKSTT